MVFWDLVGFASARSKFPIIPIAINLLLKFVILGSSLSLVGIYSTLVAVSRKMNDWPGIRLYQLNLAIIGLALCLFCMLSDPWSTILSTPTANALA